MLSLGGGFDVLGNQLLLRQAIKLGVTYWDTAESYGYGRCEDGFGKYFSKHPEDREKIFLVTKTSRVLDQMTDAVEGSLKRMNTSYIDLYLLHGISNLGAVYDDKLRS